MEIFAPKAIGMRKPVVVPMPVGKKRVHVAVLRSWRNSTHFFEMPLLLEGINRELGINAKMLSPRVAQVLVGVHNSGEWKDSAEFGNANAWMDFWYFGFPAATDTLVAHGRKGVALGSPISNKEEEEYAEMIVPREYRQKSGLLVAGEIGPKNLFRPYASLLVNVAWEKISYVERASYNLIEKIPAAVLSCSKDVEVKLAAQPNISPLGIVQVAGPVLRMAADFSASFRFALVVQMGEEDAKVLRG